MDFHTKIYDEGVYWRYLAANLKACLKGSLQTFIWGFLRL